MMYQARVLFVCILVCMSQVAAQRADRSALSNNSVRDMAYAYGFCVGQEFSLERIAKRFPMLRTDTIAAKYGFEAAFGSSMVAMDEALIGVDAKWWESTKQQMQRVFTEKIGNDIVSEEQAVRFIRSVRSRASGELEERVAQTLLMWNPAFRANPSAEMSNGFTNKFVTDGTGKSKGVKLQIEHPRSWASLEGERPNIVRKFVSERGRGLEVALITVKALPAGERLTPSDIEDAFSAFGLRAFLPPGARFVSGRRINFDGLPGALVEFRVRTDRMGKEIRMRGLFYVTFYSDRTISLLFSTSDEDATYARFEPLFHAMANSVIILNQYE